MRLWHKDLIKVLPKQQLLGQWRECCLIAKSISEKGTPNHLLVNKVIDYPMSHFWTYGIFVFDQMNRRGYKVDLYRFSKYFTLDDMCAVKLSDLFPDWHNERYLMQCIANLQEKYDCGGISKDEWARCLFYYVKEVIQ